jgi:hypothetical protein
MTALIVHPVFRRQGLANRLLGWCVERAREELRQNAVLYGGIQSGNTASLATARHWLPRQIGRFRGAAVPMRNRPPKPLPGVTVRPARESEFEDICRELNASYQGHNLVPVETPDSLASWLAHRPVDGPYRHYYLAAGEDGRLLAGLGLTEAYRTTEMHIVRMPAAMRWLNKILHIVPADGVMRRLSVSKLWFADLDAARFLWESMRWLYREQGNSLMAYYDPKSPAAAIAKIPFWLPKASLTLVIDSPVSINEDLPIYPPG